MMYFNNLKIELVKKMLEKAARNLFVENPRIKRIDEFVDFLETLSDKTYKIKSNSTSRYKLINDGIRFFQKVKLTYGIFDPLESFIVWLAIVGRMSLRSALQSNYEIEYIPGFAEAIENKFLERPSENIQKRMDLPLINCAVAKVNMEIDEDKVENISEVLSNNLKGMFSDEYQHLILLDSPTTRSGYTYRINARKLSYASAILLEILDNVDKASILFHNRDTIVRIITIESKQDKREFWNETSQMTFSLNTSIANSFSLIYDTINSQGYRQCMLNNKKLCIDIITDKDYYDSYKDEAVDAAMKLNSNEITVNLFLLEEKNLFLGYDYVGVRTMMKEIERRNLFILDRGQLICYNES